MILNFKDNKEKLGQYVALYQFSFSTKNANCFETSV